MGDLNVVGLDDEFKAEEGKVLHTSFNKFAEETRSESLETALPAQALQILEESVS